MSGDPAGVPGAVAQVRKGDPLLRGSGPSWWDLTRRIVIFALGVVCVLVALVRPGNDPGLLTVGLVLLGLLPIENWLSIHR